MNRRPRSFSVLGLHLGLERVEQLVAAGGAVGDGERDVERQSLGIGIGDDVLDRQPGGVAYAVDQIAAQPARTRLGIGGDDDLARPVGVHGVDRRGVGVGVADLADRLDVLGRG